jgi:hypothetical protein
MVYQPILVVRLRMVNAYGTDMVLHRLAPVMNPCRSK